MRATRLRTTPTLTSASSSASADLAQHLVDVGLGEAALAAELLEDAFEAG
jgi:transcriptional regulator GlxA family with amidase domain